MVVDMTTTSLPNTECIYCWSWALELAREDMEDRGLRPTDAEVAAEARIYVEQGFIDECGH